MSPPKHEDPDELVARIAELRSKHQYGAIRALEVRLRAARTQQLRAEVRARRKEGRAKK
jgi:hypothetical protein